MNPIRADQGARPVTSLLSVAARRYGRPGDVQLLQAEGRRDLGLRLGADGLQQQPVQHPAFGHIIGRAVAVLGVAAQRDGGEFGVR